MGSDSGATCDEISRVTLAHYEQGADQFWLSRSKVGARVAQYGDAKVEWLNEVFEPFLDRVDVGVMTWESVLDHIAETEAGNSIGDFYERCLEFNPLRSKRSS